MAPVQSAVVRFCSAKTCFLLVPSDWINYSSCSQNVQIFKVEYGNGKLAYFSAKVIYSALVESSAVIQVNGKYAMSLGLQEGEKVYVQELEKALRADKLIIEPLNSDDWEVLELNAAFVEKDLLNQIRVVWKDQVFPVWVNQVNLFVKIADVFPSANPGILCDFTEIHIVPKERSMGKQTGNLPRRRKKKEMLNQYQQLRRRGKGVSNANNSACITSEESELNSSSSPSIVKANNRPVFSILQYFMKSTLKNETPNVSLSKRVDEFQSFEFDFSLRVVSYSKTWEDSTIQASLPLGLQATTAFITERTFCAHCDLDVVPDCFVACLSKLLSPLQMKELSQTESHDSKDKKKEKKNIPRDTNSKFGSVCVNIVVLKSLEEEFDVPEALFRSTDFICVPLQLKRRLGLEISSRVRCKNVDVSAFPFDNILLHPMDNLHVSFDGNLAASTFEKWVSDATCENFSIVLCDGTLVKLPIQKDRSCDFIVTLANSENSDQNSSFAESPNSVSSEGSDSVVSSCPNYGFVNATQFKKITIKLGSYSPYMKKLIWRPGSNTQKPEYLYQSFPAFDLDAMGGVRSISSAAIADLEVWFKLRPSLFMATSTCSLSSHGSMLVTGEKGVGKSTFIKALCKKFINYPHFIFVSTIWCLPLRGKRVETIAKKWEMSLCECVFRQPSILIFEDLHQLASAPATFEQENGPDSLYYSSIVQVFVGILEKIIANNHNVVIIASSKSIHSLHPMLTSVKGRHVFQSVIEINPPNHGQRCEILQSLVANKVHLSDCTTSICWSKIASSTEGYIAQDLCVLVDRATHAAWIRTKNNLNEKPFDQVLLVEEDFRVALDGYTPSSLRGLKLEKGTKTWKDVGGLHEVKSTIQKVLSWPVKYKSLFENCPQRPQRNILLYGPPGTGKTLIAGVVANECELNFICIKGPELLSKFIGASEQAVRDLFVRAMSAKPCILFFDEFDALAPRRGHDSTGVTDRVVNQLLTQMDGVESMEGVYVLAATSQPELIDPALLRPGRLDKCLYCPLPNEMERLEILEALSCKLSLSEDVDFKVIASATESFSGADLQSLLYSAQVKAFHDNQTKRNRRASLYAADESHIDAIESMTYLPSVERGLILPSEEDIGIFVLEIDAVINMMSNENQSPDRRRHSVISTTIGPEHLLEVLSDMKPSVSPEEQLRYHAIFQKFQQSGGMELSMPLVNAAKRVTLA